jgi:hypothetical protein
LRSLDYRVRPLGSLRLVVAPPAGKPGKDTSAITGPRLYHLHRVGHRGWRCVGPAPRVWPLASQAACHSQASGGEPSPAFWRVFMGSALTPCPPPVTGTPLSRLSAPLVGWSLRCSNHQGAPFRAGAQ